MLLKKKNQKSTPSCPFNKFFFFSPLRLFKKKTTAVLIFYLLFNVLFPFLVYARFIQYTPPYVLRTTQYTNA